MTGPEHYREAERLATAWQDAINDLPEDRDEMRGQLAEGHVIAAQTLAAAQVHATLALAAVAARGRTSGDDPWVEITEPWAEVPF